VLEFGNEDSLYGRAYLSMVKDVPHLTLDVELNEIPLNRDVTVNVQTDIDNGGVFYTDSNGLGMEKRVLNKHTNYTVGEVSETASFNYYPVNSAISIKDGDRQVTVMNDRSQGGSVLKKGRIELMQNRRMS